MKFLSAAGTAFAALIGLVFLLAIAETVTGLFINPFGSRGMLFLVMVGLAVAAGVYRWRVLAAREQPRTTGQTWPNQPSGVGQLVASDVLARLDRIAATARAEKSAMPLQPPQQPGPSPQADVPRGGDRDPLIDAAGRQAILFRQHFPPPHDDSMLSFWGGAPIAPTGFDWPRSTAGKPLHFLMQIDCSAIPAAARLGALPDNGVLYFFLDLEWGENGGHAVIYQPAPSGEWATVHAPDDLGPLFGKEATYSWAWAQTIEHCPSLFPKWPFQPVAIEVPEFVPEDEEEEGYPILWPEKAVEDSIVQTGDVAESNYFTIRDFVDGPAICRPFPSFPHDWRAVQISSALLVKRAENARRYPEGQFREMEAPAREALLTGIAGDAQQWFERASAEPPFDPVADADRDAFWDLLASHANVSRMMITEAVQLSIESSLAASAEAAARIPSEIVDRIRSRHALAVRTESGFHVNIPDRMLAPPVDVQGNQWERAQTHLLLLEISSNEGLGHRFGEGIYQFWITPQDLRGGRFDRVELTSDAY